VNRLGNLVGYRDGTGLPHVRAIAACPVLSRPYQSCPDLGEKDTNTEKTLNGGTPFSAVQAEVAHARGEENR
jgi:hypothetical protein